MQITSFILGILSIALIFIPLANVTLSPMFGICALVLGLVGSRAARSKGDETKYGTAGMATGGIGLALGVVLIIVIILFTRHAACEWREDRTVKAEVRQEFDSLSDDFREDMDAEIRDKVHEEVALEMERVREERRKRLEKLSSPPPGPLDSAWKEDFDERIDEWMRWIEQMPITPADPADPDTTDAVTGKPDAPDPATGPGKPPPPEDGAPGDGAKKPVKKPVKKPKAAPEDAKNPFQ